MFIFQFQVFVVIPILAPFSYVLKEVASQALDDRLDREALEPLNSCLETVEWFSPLDLIDYLLSFLFQAENFSSGAVRLRSVNISKFGTTPSGKLLV